MQISLDSNFCYNQKQSEIEAEFKSAATKSKDTEYDAYLINKNASYNGLTAKQIFYFKDNLLKQIEYIIEHKDKNLTDILESFEKNNYSAVIGVESKNLFKLLKSDKDNKITDFIVKEDDYKKFRDKVCKAEKDSAYSVIFFKKDLIPEYIVDYIKLYNNLGNENVAIYVNLDAKEKQIHVGLCLPKPKS